MKILVTGSSGFLGRNIVECLRGRGHDVHGLDITKAETTDYIIDIKDRERVLSLASEGFDAIVHLAAYPNPRSFSSAGALSGLDVNVVGTINMLELAKRVNARFLLYSTSNIYGKPRKLPVTEDDPPRPFEGYGWSKVAAEAAVMSYHVTHGLPVTIFRLWKPYGPYDNGVVGIFITRALKGEDLVVNNGGVDTTDFLYTEDLCDATLAALTSERAVGEAFNIGLGVETSILDLAKLIVRLTGSSSNIRVQPQTTEAFRSYPDVSKAFRLLGFKPKYDLESGLRRTIDWFRRNL
ncbi:NAD-dependent epimerase/dehydratase family protein [Vulcanisaeta thermophila]|uniref:NAD-dependent epimerase/dehydratase family protein n=1 Tax=Vulcanisaeta thermophila TaxID=867917 RepID=UPI00085323B6|nr:NAD-dependent epimerase/dehydratase family protein [Vulcanisaeta thermophila]